MSANRAFVIAFGLVVGWTNTGHAQSYEPDSRKHAKHPKAAKLPGTRSVHDDADSSMPVVTAVDLRHHKKKKGARQPVIDGELDGEHDLEPHTHAKKNARRRLVDDGD